MVGDKYFSFYFIFLFVHIKNIDMDKLKKINNITSDLLDKAFLKKNTTLYDKIPFITIILFILALVLKTIQSVKYNDNQPEYLQKKVRDVNNKQKLDPISALFIYYLEAMGVNSLIELPDNPVWAGVIMLIFGYLILALIELNIGHSLVAYFILVLILYNSFSNGYQDLICSNIASYNSLDKSPYCCGSFIFWASIGCFLAILFICATGWQLKLVISVIASLIWMCVILFEYYGTYANVSNKDLRLCKSFYWHGCNLFFGFVSGLVLAKNIN
jgi:uncharacterized membrane protein YecN with MAPEG domain